MKELAFVILLMVLLMNFMVSGVAQSRQGIRSISGWVVAPDGSHVSGAVVLIYRTDNPSGIQRGAKSEADGHFTIAELESGVPYAICASKPEEGYLDPFFLPFGLSTGGNCKHVVLEAGLDLNGVQLQLSKRGGRLSGNLLDARTQQPVVGAKITLYRTLKLEKGTWILVNRKEATWEPSVVTSTDAAGKFSVSSLPEGSYFLRVDAAGYRNWFFPSQSSETTARPLLIKSGMTRKMILTLHPSIR